MGSRIPEDAWEVVSDHPGAQCARCGGVLDPGDGMPEILRVVAMRHGGLAIQAVGVHRSCWAAGVGEANLFLAAHTQEALDGWGEMLAGMRAHLEEMDREDEEDWEDEVWRP